MADTEPHESPPAAAAYRAYRNQGPTRSLERVAQECTKHVSLIRRWSAAHGWVARAAAHDAAIDAEVARKDATARVADAARRRDVRLKMADAFRMKAASALAKLDVDELAAQPLAIVKLADHADRTERLDTGEATERIDVSTLSDEALLARIDAIRRTRAARSGDDPPRTGD